MIDFINIGASVLTILLGLIGWLAPGYTMRVLDLKTDGSTMGTSEIRAASGALFVGLGAGALLLGTPQGYAMVGFATLGAAVGRITSIFGDDRPTRQTWGFFAYEAVLGTLLVWINLWA